MALFASNKAQTDWLIVGLGNPGPDYANTRHNAGFHAVDELASRLHARYWKSQCDALTTSVNFADKNIILAKPQTFMNLSGQAVKGLAKTYNLSPDHILVIHDEVDLPAGSLRIKQNGGHAGHNGLRSIHEKLGSSDYPRIRVGIGRPEGRQPVADYVLQALKGQTLEDFEITCKQAADAALCIVESGLVLAMNKFN